MVNTIIESNPVTEYIPPDGAVTVPTGEVWKGEIVLTGDIEINGNYMRNPGDFKAVFTGGDTIGNRDRTYFSGFDVSGIVDNTPVTEYIPSDGAVTVPTGEVWKGEIVTTGDIDINGNYMANPGNFEAVFTGGDTIGNRGEAYFSGFVVNQ